MADKKQKQGITISPDEDKGRVRIATKSDSLKGDVTLLYLKRQMRMEMDLTWKDFFEKNPGKKEEEVWQRIEERLRSEENSEDQDKRVLPMVQNA